MHRSAVASRSVVLLLALLLAGPAATVAQDATPAATPEPGFVSLFDGSEASFANWRSTGAGHFDLIDGVIVTGSNSFEMGELSLLYYASRTFDNFVLRLQFRVSDLADNSGVLVRFRDPGQPIPAADLAAADAGETYPSRALYAEDNFWIAADTGFEVQIEDAAVGNPFDDSDDGLDQHRTGGIYDIPIGTGVGEQAYQRGQDLQPGAWDDLEVEVVGDTYTVRLNGQQTTTFTNPVPGRGQSPSEDLLFGYIGVHASPFNPGHVDFRNIRIQELPATVSVAATPVRSTATVSSPSATPMASPVEVIWQTEGDPDAPLTDPFQLAIDPDGNLWVADGQSSRFLIFAPDGTFLETWGTPGSGDGEFNFVSEQWDPTGAVAFDPAGNLYVLDPGNHRVQKFAPDRTFLAAWGSEGSSDGQFGHPYDIATDVEGRVYVIDDVRDDIQVFAGDGSYLSTISSQGRDEGELNSAGGLTIAPDGTIWVADWGNNRVQTFSPEGELLATIGASGTDEGEFMAPLDVAADREGRIYVVDWGNYRVQIFAGDGGFLAAFGGFGMDEGEFAQLGGIAVDEIGAIYVSDGAVDRVTSFRLQQPLGAGTPTP